MSLCGAIKWNELNYLHNNFVSVLWLFVI